MVGRDHKPARSRGNSPSRDPDGNEHLLSVLDHPISIVDDVCVRILSPAAAVALVLDVVALLPVPARPGGRSDA